MKVSCEHHRNACNELIPQQRALCNFKDKRLKSGKRKTNLFFQTQCQPLLITNEQGKKKSSKSFFVLVLAGEKIYDPNQPEAI